MATLNIKSFPDDLYGRLQHRAERQHRSLAQEVIHLLDGALSEPIQLSLLDLKGLGKEVWRGVDAGRYVDEERRSWE
jgi:plasmid stability protein